MSTAAMMTMMKNKTKAVDANSFEIDLTEEAGILVTVKAKPNPKLAAVGEYSEGPNKEMHMLEPCRSSRIVRLTNAVTEEYDFRSDEDYEYLLDDLIDEGQRLGKLVKVVIPRPNPDPCPGVGKAFLEYADLDGASKARSAFNGNQWGMNIVLAEYFPEDMYALGQFDA